jgi:transcriptional regulator with XRE-family HTH domain
MIDRILLILKSKNLSASKFADEIGVQRSSISHIFSGRNNPSLELIQKILKSYPDINPDWLIAGNGVMSKLPDLFNMADSMATKDNTLNQVRKAESSANELKNDNVFIETAIAEKHEVKLPEVSQSKEESQVVQESSTVPKQEAKTTEKPARSQKSNKEVEKVIIFYTDNTFSCYTPEKS